MRALFVLFFAALGSLAAHAQALPYHVDPSARDLVPNLAAVPDIRFLTTADFPPFNYRDTDRRADRLQRRSGARHLRRPQHHLHHPGLALGAGGAGARGQAGRRADRRARDDARERRAVRFLQHLPDAARPLRHASRTRRGFDPAALAGKTVAVRRGSTHADFVRATCPSASSSSSTPRSRRSRRCATSKADAYLRRRACAPRSGSTTMSAAAASPAQPYFRPDLFGDGLVDRGRRRPRRRAAGHRLRARAAQDSPARWTSSTCAGSRSASTDAC